MSDLVSDTLTAWRLGRHEWGQSDCLLSVGDYLTACGYEDVPPQYRGTYDTEAGAQAHIDAAGGCDALIDRTGVPRTTEAAQRGDVALIHGIGALCTGDMFVMRLERGAVEVSVRHARPSVVWRVERGEGR